MIEVAGAILAGGKSSRMGEDKANLQLYGKTLLQHMQGILHAASIKNIYISHPNIIPDYIPGFGPLSGVHAILNNILKYPKHNDSKHIIFIPIDMPNITNSLVNKLTSVPDNVPLVYFESYKMPFRLNADIEWLELIESLFRNAEDVSLGNFQQNIHTSCQIKTFPDGQECFRNINTPEEWSRFLGEEKI